MEVTRQIFGKGETVREMEVTWETFGERYREMEVTLETLGERERNGNDEGKN